MIWDFVVFNFEVYAFWYDELLIFVCKYEMLRWVYMLSLTRMHISIHYFHSTTFGKLSSLLRCLGLSLHVYLYSSFQPILISVMAKYQTRLRKTIIFFAFSNLFFVWFHIFNIICYVFEGCGKIVNFFLVVFRRIF